MRVQLSCEKQTRVWKLPAEYICVRSVHYRSISVNMVKQRVLVTNPDVHQEAIDLLRRRYIYAIVLYFNHCFF